MSVESQQSITPSDPEAGVSVERWDEITRELDAITDVLNSLDGRLSSIDDLLLEQPTDKQPS